MSAINRQKKKRAVPAQPAGRRTSTTRKDHEADLNLATTTAADRADLEQAAATEGVDLAVVSAAVPPGGLPPESAGELEERLLKAFDALNEQRVIYGQCAERAREREEQAAEGLQRAEAEA